MHGPFSNIALILLSVFYTAGCFANCCTKPDRGLPGPRGLQGATGDPGPTGTTGPSATAVFISLYENVNSQVVNPQESVLFDAVSAQQGNITYSSGVVTLTDAGLYYISFGITGSPSNRQMAIRVNGGLVAPGSQIDTQNSQMQGIGFNYSASAGTTIELINNQPNDSGDTVTLSSSTPDSVNVYMNIKRIY